MLKEVQIDRAMTYEYPPDGTTLPIIDPYDGCTIGCPYCFRLEDENWNKNLIVKLNIAEILCEELTHWNKEEVIYLGSKCDPYMGIERKYQLTRKCLIELSKLSVKCMVTTKAGSKLIYRDIDVIKPMEDKFTLLLGLSNLEQLKRMDPYSMMSNIQTANELHRMGIKVWAFITPILPGITNVDEMINALDKNIPVFLDRIRIGKNNRPGLEKYIGKNYPHLTSTYNDILNNNIDVYFDRIREKWSNDQRVQFVFE